MPMCTAVASVATEGKKTRADMKSVGLVDAHAYSLIAAAEVQLDNGRQERLIQIRNPWGRKEWTGDWSDNSPLWTDTVKRQVNYVNKDDGCFWIALNDYVQFFYITTICYYSDNISDNTIPDQHSLDSFGMSTFTLDEDHPEPLTIAIDQVNARFVDETMRGAYEYPGIRVMLTRIDTVVKPKGGTFSEQVFLGGSREADTHVAVPVNLGLKKGTYLIVYKAEFTPEYIERKLVVNVYSDRKIDLKTVGTESYTQERFEIMDEILFNAIENDTHDDI